MFCLTGTNIINSLRQRIPKRSSTSFHVHFEVVAMFNSIPLVPSFSVCAKNAGSTGFPRTSWAWVVACLPSGFSGRSMKRQSHLIAVVSQFKKKKKTVRKLAKFVRGEDLRTKPSYEGARSLLATLTCLCSITSNLTAQKSHWNELRNDWTIHLSYIVVYFLNTHSN